MKKLSAVLSDIGEVVAPFDNTKTFEAFSRFSGYPADQVADIMMGRGLPLLDRYERGEVDSEEYQKIICSRLNLSKQEMPIAGEFYLAYADVFTKRPEVIAEWARLRAQGVVMVAVSNICEMRYRWLRAMGVFEGFDHEILSFKEGLRKPSEELMVRALDRAGTKAGESLFVDDIAVNLEPAKRLGMVTHHFTGVAPFQEFIRDLGV